MTTPICSTSVSRRSVSRSEEHTSELQSQSNLVCRLLLEKKQIQKCGDAGIVKQGGLRDSSDTHARTHACCGEPAVPLEQVSFLYSGETPSFFLNCSAAPQTIPFSPTPVFAS